ncbi:MAG: ribonuclease R [Bacilli bacterium]|jgi:ribonuclease R
MKKVTLYEFIKSHPYVNIKVLHEEFSNTEELQTELDTLLQTGMIIEEYGRYLLPEIVNLKRGKIIAVRYDYALLELEDSKEEIRLELDDLDEAMRGDSVLVKRRNKKYYVDRIYARPKRQIVGEIINLHPRMLLKVRGLTLSSTRFVLNGYPKGKLDEIIVGQIIDYQPLLITVEFQSSLGQKNAPGVDIAKIILENGAPIEFEDEVDEAVQKIPLSISEAEIKNRLDLRKELVVTIDGEDARDFDDAISLVEEDNHYLLGVHIADVSYYVRPKGVIDAAAQERGTSIYVIDRVIPMLPFHLSNGICSLQPNKDRLTLSCLLKISKEGEVIDAEIKETVIRSQARLTYTYFQKVIERGISNNQQEEMLLNLYRLSLMLRKKRLARGSLDLDLPELKVLVDEEGKPTALLAKINNDAEKVIEDLMILANEVVAAKINNRHLPFIYRIHEYPDPKRLEEVNMLLIKRGYKPEINPRKITSKTLQNFLNRFRDKEDFVVFQERTLQALARARYDVNNYGHFGLASVCYTHFTSPIRRYPDLLVHRLVKSYLLGEKGKKKPILKEVLQRLAIDASAKERRAVVITRAVNDMKAAEYMSNFLGQKFRGYIDGFLNSGIFITLDNGVSGLVPLSSLPAFYHLEKSRLSIRSKQNHIYTVGDRVEVLIAAANKETGNIDLELIEDKAIKTFTPQKNPASKRKEKYHHKPRIRSRK